MQEFCADLEGDDRCGMGAYMVRNMAQMLRLRQHGALPPAYAALMPHVLRPAPWKRSSSVPALASLVRAYLQVGVG